MINVWITEKSNGDGSYCFMDHADNRSEVVETLNQTILTDGVVPDWIKSIKFYEQGDSPTETYRSGDTIEVES
jgi:hypothetical protein